jgi:hypothetical protein
MRPTIPATAPLLAVIRRWTGQRFRRQPSVARFLLLSWRVVREEGQPHSFGMIRLVLVFLAGGLDQVVQEEELGDRQGLAALGVA